MESGATVSKQLDDLYKTGFKLSGEFLKYQWERQCQEEESEEAEQKGSGEGEQEEPEGDWSEADQKALEESAEREGEFPLMYQRWYSITLSLMKKHAPDRFVEFEAYYEPDRKRGEVSRSNYVIRDWFCDREFDVETSAPTWTSVGRCFLNQLIILKSVKERLEWQALITDDQVERAMQLDLLQTAQVLLKINERAAGALAGTVLATYIRKLAAKHRLKSRKQEPPLGELADALKEARVLDVPAWSQVTWLSEIRTRCLKSEGESPTKLQVRDLIDGTRWLITNVF